MTPVLASHPETEKEDEGERERAIERKRERNNALFPNTCNLNLIFEIIHI